MENIFKEAHEMTRKMVEEYGVNYQTQFGLCISYLFEIKKEEGEMKLNRNLEGTEKQVQWANDLLNEIEQVLSNIEKGSYEIYKKEKSLNAIKERLDKTIKVVNKIDHAANIINRFKTISYSKNKVEDILGELQSLTANSGLGTPTKRSFIPGIIYPNKLIKYATENHK